MGEPFVVGCVIKKSTLFPFTTVVGAFGVLGALAHAITS